MVKTQLVALVMASMVATASYAEGILGVSISSNGVTYQVHSGGCTAKRDFRFKLLETLPVKVELVRINPDFCRAFLPYGKTMTFSYEEMGMKSGDRFSIANDIMPIQVY